MKTKEEFWLDYYNLLTEYEIMHNQKTVIKDAFICGYDSCKNLLLDFANALNEEAGFPLNGDGFEEYIEDFLNKQS